MTSIAKYVGLDVHKDSIQIAVAPEGRDAPRHVARIPSDYIKLMKQLDKLGARASLHVCYEAGPTGYGVYRKLVDSGIDCIVVAPTKIPSMTGDRVKTDRRDAAKLAHYHRSGDLTAVWVPGHEVEALRDLVRARTAAKEDERAVRHRLSKFLLRHDRIYPGKTAWTGMHLDWIRKQDFEPLPQTLVLCEHLNALEDLRARIKTFDHAIDVEGRASSLWPLIHGLQALKGVRTLTATAIAAEIGDLQRFDNARDFMSYVGLVPSERSTGDSKKRGNITKTGNTHVRRLLIESAWSYRHSPKKSTHLRGRTKGLDSKLTRIGWRAQQRLHGRYRRLLGRGKRPQVVVTALARELAGFVWCIGQEVQLSA
ncbi:MAG TPA: IS110 family transposase [Nannocystis exedens]|nr:IS110 family transposase [Nannocystis exedens]